MDPARRWKQIQAKIDFCWDCLCIGGDLLAPRNQNPARPPYIDERPVLFLSEAPPPSGGFWAPYPVQDDLRENLFGILRAFGVYLPKDDHARETLDAFRAMGLFLVQTVKWPLQDSARSLRPTERKLIEQSVRAHLVPELQMLRPLAIICLGKVASYACSLCFPQSKFRFVPSARLESVRGKCFDVEVSPGFQAHLYPTELPVRRRMGGKQRIVEEIRQVLQDHWNAQVGHVTP
jgi:hypothetical protein